MMLRVLCRCAAATLLLAVLYAPTAHAGSVLDKVKSKGVVRCGGVSRPGLALVGTNGSAAGLLLDLCRAIAAAVLPGTGRLEFRTYDSAKTYDAVRHGDDDVFFLSGSEILGEELAGRVSPGPPVFYETTAVMVAEQSKVQNLSDLGGEPICFAQGSSAERHIEAWFGTHHLDFVRMGFQEDVEMYDAYNVQMCRAITAESTTLAQVRLDGGVNELRSRILPEPLTAFPIMAATGTKDAQWSAIVAWTMHTLVRAETLASHWSAGGLDTLPIEAPELGLGKDWQKRVVGAVGTYGDIFRRNLGEASPYKLPRGLNAPWQDGGLMLAPYSE
jgi:general L-amino acid transport system substrate-binding protein